jgi:amino acid transporter
VLVGILAVANLCGVKAGAGVSNFLAISKLVPLVVFIVAGLVLLHGPAPARSAAPLAALAPVSKDWLGAILLLVFAYGGFDSATFSMCEARNTRRDAPFALFTALGIVVVVYTLIQVVVLRALGGDPGGGAPLAAAARVFLGPAGTIFISAGALLSVYGNLSQSMLNSPRLTYALAERGDFPTVFAAIGRRFRTPYVSIIAFALVTFAFSLFASFRWNAVLAAVGRVFTYGIVCTAVLTLRSRQPQADAFRLPAAPLWIAVGLLFLGAAALRMGRSDLIAVSATSGLALAHWLAIRQRPSPPAA